MAAFRPALNRSACSALRHNAVVVPSRLAVIQVNSTSCNQASDSTSTAGSGALICNGCRLLESLQSCATVMCSPCTRKHNPIRARQWRHGKEFQFIPNWETETFHDRKQLTSRFLFRLPGIGNLVVGTSFARQREARWPRILRQGVHQQSALRAHVRLPSRCSGCHVRRGSRASSPARCDRPVRQRSARSIPPRHAGPASRICCTCRSSGYRRIAAARTKPDHCYRKLT